MKKHRQILLILTVVGAVFALALLLARFANQNRISLAVVEHRKWPHGAMLRLRNNTSKTIRYVAERNDTPMGAPIFKVEKTSNGWADPSVTIDSVRAWNGSSPGSNDVLFIKPITPTPGQRLTTLITRELRPGESVDFFVFLEPRAPPARYGTICLYPQSTSKTARQLQAWLSRVKQWCRMKNKLPGQIEVWCQQPLAVSESGEPLAVR